MTPDGRRRYPGRRALILSAAGLLAAGAAGTGVAVATSDDGDASVTGPAAERATRAALAATGGGRANSVERDSEDGATWEVEVTRRDGSTVDVRLDSDLHVVVVEGDDETTDPGGADR